MQPIHSGTTTGRIARATLLLVLVNGFAVAYLWDGYVGYARDNAKVLVESLGLEPGLLPDIDPELTDAEGRRLAAGIQEGGRTETVTSALGKPAFEHDHDSYHLGPGGHLRIQKKAGRVVEAAWKVGLHSESDLRWQRWIGYTLGLIGLVVIGHFGRVITTRVSLTEAGLKIGRKPAIPFDAITELSAAAKDRGDAVTIRYTVDGQARVVQLDDYVVKELPAIVAALRDLKESSPPSASTNHAPLTGAPPTSAPPTRGGATDSPDPGAG